MSRSLSVTGFVPPDDKFRKMLEVHASCEAAGVPVPEAVLTFFNDERPDATGVKIGLTYDRKYNAVKEYNDEDGSGFEVDLRNLPKDIKILRFTIS